MARPRSVHVPERGHMVTLREAGYIDRKMGKGKETRSTGSRPPGGSSGADRVAW
jgi:hypothetical protein